MLGEVIDQCVCCLLHVFLQLPEGDFAAFIHFLETEWGESLGHVFLIGIEPELVLFQVFECFFTEREVDECVAMLCQEQEIF